MSCDKSLDDAHRDVWKGLESETIGRDQGSAGHRRCRRKIGHGHHAAARPGDARIMDIAGADETVVSSTIKDPVIGSDIAFDDRGSHHLKGIEGQWQLYSVVPGRSRRF